MKARYINPYTDFGFKKLFGEDASKDLLKDFLNQLLPEKYQIFSLSFNDTESLSEYAFDRKAIFDISCESADGSKFIVEMQKEKHRFFKDRAIFYTTFPIREQAEKGDWNFKLNPIFCVAILDFIFEKEKSPENYLSKIQLKNEFCEIFYDKLMYIFIEMPRFNKTENEISSHFDKWLYFLKNLEDFNEIPQILNEPIFKKGFEIAEIANYDEKQKEKYEESLKVYRDLRGVIDTSKEDGMIEGELRGHQKGKIEKAIEIAKIMKQNNESTEKIQNYTGLTVDEIQNL